MIWLWLTCFSLMLAPGLPAANLTGRVALRDSKEKTVERERNYAGVVVWLEPAAGHAPQPASPPHAVMQQKGKRFTPHVLAVRTGTVVDFPNLDPIFHNAFSSFSGQIFDIGLYKPGSSRGVAFNRPGVVRVFCNIHAAMSAVIVVINGPGTRLRRRTVRFRFHGFRQASTGFTFFMNARRLPNWQSSNVRCRFQHRTRRLSIARSLRVGSFPLHISINTATVQTG